CDATSLGGDAWVTKPERKFMARVLAEARRRELQVFVASGDSGAYDCQENVATDLRLRTDWPADARLSIAVGGTRIWAGADGNYVREAGWEDVLSTLGSGGGLNPTAPRAPWQSGPGVTNAYTNGRREVPDVAAPADPDSGYLVVFRGRRTGKAGTSGAAPFWAGVAALVQEYVRAQTGRRVPFLPPLLYRLAATRASPFHDVVVGGNRYYRATPGWDYATGLGTPDVAALAERIASLGRVKAARERP